MMPAFHVPSLCATFAALVLFTHAAQADQRSDAYLEAVQSFADHVLEIGRDRFGDEHTPLFADGVRRDTLEPAVWQYDGNEWIISNFANQQTLMRTLVGLSALTGDERYRDAAEAATRHMFDHYQNEGGLFYWGGHQFIDLATGNVARGFDSNSHELKQHLPFYEWLWQVDAQGTQRFVEALWSAHVIDWERLDMSRHGSWGVREGSPWDRDYSAPEPFFEGRGLTFINAATDLVYAAAFLGYQSSDEQPLLWAKRLAHQYVAARHPETHLGVYQYSQPTKRDQWQPGDRFTSNFGDRAQLQFGPELGEVALEGNFLRTGHIGTIYGHDALAQLLVAESLGDAGQHFLEWTHAGLKAYARFGLDADNDLIRPLLADGTDLTGFTYPRDGYYGPAGRTKEARSPSPILFRSYALAYRLTGDDELWPMVRSAARAAGLGDLGQTPAHQLDTNRDHDVDEPNYIFGLLDLYRATNEPAYLQLAQRAGDNILENRFHDQLFVPSDRHVYARFDAPEPLALLTLVAVERQQPHLVPVYPAGSPYIHGNYEGHGRTYDNRVLWRKTRD